MNGKKIPPRIGENGRLYFNFNVRAVYRFTDIHGQVFDYEITASEYCGTTEYYNVSVNGLSSPAPISANRLNFLLSVPSSIGMLNVATLNPGEPQELPLLIDEVKLFYVKQAERRAQSKKAAKQALEKTKYAETEKAIKALYAPIAFAENMGNATKSAELNSQLDTLENQRREILKKANVDLSLFEPRQPSCPKCKDFGSVDNVICSCAFARAEEIKSFAAAQRIAERLSKARG